MADKDFDTQALERSLRRALRGQVRADSTTRAMYASDASNYRVTPDLVVIPSDREDLVAAVGLIGAFGAPLVMRGSGTSMAGNAIGGVIIETTTLNRIIEVDPSSRTATVEPGVVLSDLNTAAAKFGLTFGVDPSSGTRATIGGMVASNACGAHSVAWGTTADNVSGLDIMLADGAQISVSTTPADHDVASKMTTLSSQHGREGQLHRALQELAQREHLVLERRFSSLRRRISGYSVDSLLPDRGYEVSRLLCGSEGTLAATLQANLRLVELPAATVLLVAGFKSAAAAATSVTHLLPFGPLTIESINRGLVERLPEKVREQARAAGLPEGTVWLLIEVGGEDPVSTQRIAGAMVAAVRDAGIYVTSSIVMTAAAQRVLWRCRRDGTGLATRRPDGHEAWAGWEDAAVPPDRLAEYLTELDDLLAQFGYSGTSYGHFGEGCMHMRIDFDLLSTNGIKQYRSFVEQATDLVVNLGGSVSGEHGDGRARSELLGRMYGDDVLTIFRDVKRIFDPTGQMNPGIIVAAAPLDDHLKLNGPAAGRELLTVFNFPDDGGSFSQAQRRCVGIAKCRQSSGGVMCPSYQVTREEKHSTRGRARLLWEMIEGDTITRGWRSPEVRDALDLCLSCKGCLSDCPVNVDMATYKSEFQSHFYRWRLRPRSHYSMGWLPVWAALASLAPRIVNALARSRLAPLLKRAGGIARERRIPAFASRSFLRTYRHTQQSSAKTPGHQKQRVVLWPDTFTNYLSPDVGEAAVRVLEAAGLKVIVPTRPVCCGLTWISTGQLGIAKRVLSRSLSVLEGYLEQDMPILVLEPSCLAVFRHDGAALLPDDERAARAKAMTFSLAELLARYAPNWQPPLINTEALVQVHCHQHAVIGVDPDLALMKAAGLDADVLDSGCCGLAGNFGFEAGHYEVSIAVGERVLLPAVRAVDPSTPVLADGFSCRTQIGENTDRSARHLAQILAEHLDNPSYLARRHP